MGHESLPTMVVLALLAGNAAAQPAPVLDGELTRQLVARDASAARGRRQTVAAVSVALGVGIGVGGYLLVQDGKTRGDFIEGPLERLAGYVAIGTGAFTAIVTPTIVLLVKSKQEHTHAELESSIAAGDRDAGLVRARDTIAEQAALEARGRRRFRILGASMFAGAAAGGITYLATPSQLGDDTRGTILGISGMLAVAGTISLVSSLGQSSWERSNERLGRSTTTVVPVRSGALLSVAGSF